MFNQLKRVRVLPLVCLIITVVFLIMILVYSLLNESNDPPTSQESPGIQDYIDPNDENKPNADFSRFDILSTKEEGNAIVVETTFGCFQYPTAFSDLITVKAKSEDLSANIEFFVQINSKEVPLFTVHYGGTEGNPCGLLTLSEDTKPIVVSVIFATPPADLSSENEATFGAAQEIFNDVIASMEEDPRFSTR